MNIPFTNRTWCGLGRRTKHLYRKHIVLPLARALWREIEVQTQRSRLTVDLNDGYISRLLFVNGGYETELQEVIAGIEVAGGVCVDVGANIGIHTVLLSSLSRPDGLVYAYEPDPRNFALLSRNLKNNGCDNVLAENCAIGHIRTHCQIIRDASSFGDSHISPAHKTGATTVPMWTLDERLQHLPSGCVRLVKIDVEGYDAHVLEGMLTVLTANPDMVLVVEIWPEGLRRYGCSPIRFVDRLFSLGFQGWEIAADRITTAGEPWVYGLIEDYVNLVLCKNPTILRRALPERYKKRLQLYP